MHKALHAALVSVMDPAQLVATAARLEISAEDLILLGIGRPSPSKLSPSKIEGAARFWSELPNTAERLREAFPFRCPMCSEVGPIHRPTPPEPCKACTAPRCAACAKLPSCSGCEALERVETSARDKAAAEKAIADARAKAAAEAAPPTPRN